MIKVLLFGRIREEMDCDSLEVISNSGSADLATLELTLIQQQGDKWRQMLAQENLIRAVNHQIVSDNPALKDGDEVAFFPPVTGG